jgi:hypothetical protein
MRYRKLRISWSVACVIACVLLIVLWVRSYWWADFCEKSFSTYWFKMESFCGQSVFKYGHIENEPWRLRSYPTDEMVSQDFLRERGIPKFELGRGVLLVPYWSLSGLAAFLAAFPWLPFKRFSLRTLLIATTLVALVLGLIVWLR